jgi:hypothetical protein
MLLMIEKQHDEIMVSHVSTTFAHEPSKQAIPLSHRN